MSDMIQTHSMSLWKEIRPQVFLLVVLVLLLAALAPFSGNGKAAFVSPEVQFTDSSLGGLSIVPASCPSSPHNLGDCTVQCTGSVPPNANLCSGDSSNLTQNTSRTLAANCSAPAGSAPKCEYTCVSGYALQNGRCVPTNQFSCTGSVPSNANLCSSDSSNLTQNTSRTLATSCSTPAGSNPKCEYTCASGYQESGNQCVLVSCPIGYTLQNGQCLFTGCPANHTLQNGQCVPPNSVGFIPFSATSATGGLFTATGHLDVRPSLVRTDDTVRVYWNVSNMSSCTVQGSNSDRWSDSFSGSSGQTSASIVGQTTYTLTCNALPGAQPSVVTETVTVNITPVFREN